MKHGVWRSCLLTCALGVAGCQWVLPYGSSAGGEGIHTDGRRDDVGSPGVRRELSWDRPPEGQPPAPLRLEAQQDAGTSEGFPETSYGDEALLRMGYCAASPGYKNMRVWLKFDLQSIPMATSIKTATLRLFYFVYYGSQDYGVHFSSDDTWNEKTLTWNNQPRFDATATAVVSGYQPDNEWQSWDVTSLVKQEHAGDQKLTLVLQGTVTFPRTEPSDHEGYARSKEYSDPLLKPHLVVAF
jgi:hypothetical protein